MFLLCRIQSNAVPHSLSSIENLTQSCLFYYCVVLKPVQKKYSDVAQCNQIRYLLYKSPVMLYLPPLVI